MGSDPTKRRGTGVAPLIPRAGDLRAARAKLRSVEFRALRTLLHDTDAITLAHQVEITEIAAPPFSERRRGERMAQLLAECGAGDVGIDAVGNVIGWHEGPARESDAPIVVAAHLDTVFGEGTDVAVTRDGDRFSAPGIADDGRGLAALLALCRVFARSDISVPTPLVFVATVGEEGRGDLRGCRHLFSDAGAAPRARAFVSLDGAGRRGIVHRGLGARRLRVRVQGPGGHSWTDWGRANPIQAIGSWLADLGGVQLPPATTLSAGRVGGGTSVNAIPQEAWAEIEVRGLRTGDLDDVEALALSLLANAVEAVNRGRADGTRPLSATHTLIGSRPAGETPADTSLVRAAVAATAALACEPAAVPASTDANVPMAAGIPAITIGAGGQAGGVHTTDEWYRNVHGPDGIARAALTLLLLEELG